MAFTLDAPTDLVFATDRVTLGEVKFHAKSDLGLRAVVEALDTDQWPRLLGKYKSVKHEL